MLHIAVCDDENRVLLEICKRISSYLEHKKIKYEIYDYCDGNELLNDEKSFDIIFLDIEMKHSNGIEIAQRIREIDMNVPIVYITSYTDYWRRAYKVHAFDFITKPFKAEELYKVLSDFLDSIRDANEETITFPTCDGMVQFKVNEIYYLIFESKKKVYLNTACERVLVKENLIDIYERLDKSQFYQTRRDCIVNLKYVQKTQNDFVIVMKNGTLLPLAQKKKDDFLRCFSKELINKLKGNSL